MRILAVFVRPEARGEIIPMPMQVAAPGQGRGYVRDLGTGQAEKRPPDYLRGP
jgi:hypothetical protein